MSDVKPSIPNDLSFLDDQPDFVRYRRLLAISAADDTGYLSIILAGAYVEHYIRSSVRAELPSSERFLNYGDGKEYPHDFMTLLKLVYALEGITKPIYELFETFSRLRNRFAHGVDESASSQKNQGDIRKLLKLCVPLQYRSDLCERTLELLDRVKDDDEHEAYVFAIRIIVAEVGRKAMLVENSIADYVTEYVDSLDQP
jgi:hypothetical protein